MENLAFQTSSTISINTRSARAFTLVEVMVGAGLSSLILAGVLSTFLLMGRTSANVINYADTEASARKVLELIGREVHQAYGIDTFSPTSVTLGIPDNTTDLRVPVNPTANGAYKVTYTFDAANKWLTRAVNGGTAEILVTAVEQISSPITPFINYYKHVHASAISNVGEGYLNAVDNTNTTNIIGEIKQMEFSFVIKRKNVTVTTASNKVISARFILRNK